MTPLPAPLGGAELVAWRLDQQRHAAGWDSGEGAFRAGGRWNSRGTRAVYCSVDPATAILEVAVHKGFRALDTVAHVLTSLTILDPGRVHVLDPAMLPNPHWLRPGIPSAGQQEFGDALLARHGFALVPSVISARSWNLVFLAPAAELPAAAAAGASAAAAAIGYRLRAQERFALDPRLHPPG